MKVGSSSDEVNDGGWPVRLLICEKRNVKNLTKLIYLQDLWVDLCINQKRTIDNPVVGV